MTTSCLLVVKIVAKLLEKFAFQFGPEVFCFVFNHYFDIMYKAYSDLCTRSGLDLGVGNGEKIPCCN